MISLSPHMKVVDPDRSLLLARGGDELLFSLKHET